MLSFNASRCIRAKRRQALRQTLKNKIIRIEPSSSESSGEEEIDQSQPLPTVFADEEIEIDASPYLSEYEEDDFDKNDLYSSSSSYENTSPPLFDGSDTSVIMAGRRLVSFFINSNLDKQTSTNLLKLIKSLLPQPNKLPTTWRYLMKSVGHVSKTLKMFLCGECHER